jgi:hypothetical protein
MSRPCLGASSVRRQSVCHNPEPNSGRHPAAWWHLSSGNAASSFGIASGHAAQPCPAVEGIPSQHQSLSRFALSATLMRGGKTQLIRSVPKLGADITGQFDWLGGRKFLRCFRCTQLQSVAPQKPGPHTRLRLSPDPNNRYRADRKQTNRSVGRRLVNSCPLHGSPTIH